MKIASPTLSPLYAIANVDTLLDPLGYVKKLLSSGITLLQLRSKSLADQEFIQLAADVVAARRQLAPNATILINDSPAVCKAAAADGVHLGQGDENPESARRLLGPLAVIGLSTHTLQQIEQPPVELLDYLALGPIYPSPTKVGHAEIVGIETLADACRLSALPLVAIGGITSKNAAEVYRAGAASAAIISELQNSDSISLKIQEFAAAHETNRPRLANL